MPAHAQHNSPSAHDEARQVNGGAYPSLHFSQSPRLKLDPKDQLRRRTEPSLSTGNPSQSSTQTHGLPGGLGVGNNVYHALAGQGADVLAMLFGIPQQPSNPPSSPPDPNCPSVDQDPPVDPRCECVDEESVLPEQACEVRQESREGGRSWWAGARQFVEGTWLACVRGYEVPGRGERGGCRCGVE
ncbi:hypothetical protein BJ508DRAFT_419046 [Ascobolus immersus RN42]|uniref:Uncharacterized protein n=1 Tax=Ascobolus immersus RN42 TaxID=1160509 RepID=A0A3N4HLL2_ASCIM|nr:hypothetical protein BJ508DRAFT_419046 [Ascobolus immersus RN42]